MLHTNVAGVAFVTIGAISQVVLVRTSTAAYDTNYSTLSCHGRRACIPLCSMRVAPVAAAVVYYCCPFSADGAVTLLAAAGSFSCCYCRHPLCSSSCYTHYSFTRFCHRFCSLILRLCGLHTKSSLSTQRHWYNTQSFFIPIVHPTETKNL